MKQFKLEADFKAAFANEFDRWGGYAKPIVSGMHSPGFPDYIFCSKNGAFTVIEFKMWRNKNKPTNAEHLLSLLDGPQVNVIKNKLFRRKSQTYVLALLMHEQPTCVYTDYTLQISLDNWENCAKILAQT